MLLTLVTRFKPGDTGVQIVISRSSVSIAVVLLGALGSAGAQQVERPLFESHAPLELTIEGPFRALSRDGEERPERDGLVRYLDAQGDEVVLDVAIRIRGNSRVEICSFNPLRLNFKRGQVGGTLFAGQNQLKLVTLCKRGASYRDYLAQEYQTYRAYNALTDRSFRVRWLTVNYVETGGRRPSSFTEHAFLIEEDWEVAERHGMEVVEVESLTLPELDPQATALLAVFQFMTGNTDWSGTSGPPGEDCCHNGAVMAPPGSGQLRVLVPYDFDQSGLIDTEYALPSDGLGIRSVTQRLYRGYCSANQELDWAIQHVNERRAQVLSAFESDLVSERAKRRAVGYLSESYEIINDAERMRSDIVERCRG